MPVVQSRKARNEVRSPAPDVTFRPLTPSDLAALRVFVGRLSRDTSYKRLLSGRRPDEEELRRWSSVDRAREEAIAAIAREGSEDSIVGVARYVKESAEDADFAIVLGDAWQGRGLGKLLLAALIASAK